ncbi:hypothetical protein TBLA_0A04320 [Henningerozyma blattae CBS 6284]|uniref:Uncharacterized protein n=1 Tax=Henningerozyma blattae (strain ATCC 34711 / CBS 6284 / DSM 70876 / NBRC 10599 / NRRL Y-10934 / UCD 77-7) TaxID=1071380 RepID=I2GVS5_HENB6|nr:hypothetical protein TBLA_0A04320 [Tetrapisispora blattae CBS 6284]CCH58227.1 hypothetical protein TBLA_0A04320 [Tetrapisispora blattae CBS 6284]
MSGSQTYTDSCEDVRKIASSNTKPILQKRGSTTIWHDVNTESGWGDIAHAIPYMSNYFPSTNIGIRPDSIMKARRKNRMFLDEYFKSKGTSFSIKKSIPEGSSKYMSTSGENYLDDGHLERFKGSGYQPQDDLLYTGRNMLEDFGIVQGGYGLEELQKSDVLLPYTNYTDYLHIATPMTPEVWKTHTLWIPNTKYEFRTALQYRHDSDYSNVTTENGTANYLKEKNVFHEKTTPLFLSSVDFLPECQGDYNASIVLPSLFSDTKFPALSYHCSVQLRNRVYILGGISPSYGYDNEMPILTGIKVEGVENLPPPILPDVINNPAMIENTNLYVFCPVSCRFFKPEISGNIPPALLCMQGTKLTDRYILYYGGFEIVTRTHYDENNQIVVEKHCVVNSVGYLLDAMTFNFSIIQMKCEDETKLMKGRFGHLQVSIPQEILGYCQDSRTSDINFGPSFKISGKVCPLFTKDDFNPENTDINISRSESISSIDTQFKGLMNFSDREILKRQYVSGIYTTIVFGGYQCDPNGEFIATNDMWKVDIPVVAKGKKGYYKFSAEARVTRIGNESLQGDMEIWPNVRGFAGFCVPKLPLWKDSDAELEILKNLKDNFSVLRKYANSNVPNETSKPLFPIGSPKSTKSNGPSGPVLQLHINETSEGHTLVMHGGSNATHIYSDMWWFDFETESWVQIETQAQTEDKGLVPIEMALAGHSMATVGSASIFVGGMMQSDVDKLYLRKHSMPLPPNAPGCTMLNMFDLSTQCLKGYTVNYDEENPSNTSLNMKSTTDTTRLCIFGAGISQYGGSIYLTGGIVTKRQKIHDLRLAGTVVEFILPIIALDGCY